MLTMTIDEFMRIGLYAQLYGFWHQYFVQLRTRKLEEIAGQTGQRTKAVAKDKNNEIDDSTLKNIMNGTDDVQKGAADAS